MTVSRALIELHTCSFKGRGRIRTRIGPRVNFWIRQSGDPVSLSPACRMRRRIFLSPVWYNYNVIWRNAIHCTERYFRQKCTKWSIMPFWLKVYRKLHQSSWSKAHSKAPTSAHETLGHIGCQNPSYMHFPRPNSESSRQTYKHILQLPSPRKPRKETGRHESDFYSDAVFPELQIATKTYSWGEWRKIPRTG